MPSHPTLERPDNLRQFMSDFCPAGIGQDIAIWLQNQRKSKKSNYRILLVN